MSAYGNGRFGMEYGTVDEDVKRLFDDQWFDKYDGTIKAWITGGCTCSCLCSIGCSDCSCCC